jgi:hypothetical protein
MASEYSENRKLWQAEENKNINEIIALCNNAKEITF